MTLNKPIDLSHFLALRTIPMGILMAVLLSLGLLSYSNTINKIEQNAFHDTVGEYFHDAIEKTIKDTVTRIEEIAQNDLVINALIDTDQRDQYLPLYLRSLTVSGYQEPIYITDYRGNLITDNGLKKANFEQLGTSWRAIYESGQTYVKLEEDGLIIASPILLSSSPEGGIITRVSTHNLNDLLYLKSKKMDFLLLKEDQTVLYSSEQEAFTTGMKLIQSDYTDWKFKSHQKISPLNLTLITALHDQHAHTLLHKLYAAIGIAIIGLGFAVGGVISLTSRRLSMTLNNLSSTIEALNKSDSDHLDERVFIDENDPIELTTLANQFNQMLEKLDNTTTSKQQVTHIINSLSELLVVTDTEGHITQENPNFQHFIQQIQLNLPTDFQQSGITSIHTLKSLFEEKDWHSLFSISSNINLLEKEYELKNSGDSALLIQWRRSELINDNGTIIGFIFTGQDITSIRQAESELKIMKQALDSSENGIVISSTQKSFLPIIYVNPAFIKTTGYSREESLGVSCSFLQGKDTDPDTIKALQQALKRRDAISVEILNYRKDGSEFWNELALSPVHNSQNEITHYIGIQNDVTVRKEQEALLEQARKDAEAASIAKGEFLASMSHEIRTPMNGVLGMLGLVLKTKLDDTQQRYANLAESSAKSLLALINDILDFSKIEANKLDIEQVAFNPKTLFTDIIDSMSLLAQNKGIGLKLNTHQMTSEALISDPTRLRQVLTNLISNAIKFTHEGCITVNVDLNETQASDVKLTFSVEDTGIGIPQEKLGLLFESFSQVDASTTRKYGGTGLGLAIVKKLCELMGGEIHVASELGKGSKFYGHILVTQPQQKPSQTPSNPNADDIEPLTPNKESQWSTENRVLLVEDNVVNQIFTEAILEEYNLDSQIAENGLDAIQTLLNCNNSEQLFDLILMDCQMPEMDGYETTRQIRAGKAGSQYIHTPIIAMTANAMQGDEEQCLNAGMTDYITKPIDPKQFEKKLSKWLTK